jgi:hypothetical protein
MNIEPPKDIRILRYHMSSGHILSEIVDGELIGTSDADLLEHLAKAYATNPYLTIKEAMSGSAVLVRTDRIEFTQIGHAEFMAVLDMEGAERSEAEAMDRAREHLSGDDDDE